MSRTALLSTERRTRAIRRARPLLSVMTWELRRFCASRLFWLQAVGYFCFLLVAIWTLRMPSQMGRPTMPGREALDGFVAGTSVWGLLLSFPSTSLLLLVLLLPFVMADGVVRDVRRRTHELLLTTAVPTWAYVWGRYLAGLLISLGLAGLLLVAILGMGLLLHLTIPAYPLPVPGALMLLWVGMVVPTTVMISSLSFALGTLLPRLTNLVKFVVLSGWIIGAVIAPTELGETKSPAGDVAGPPASGITARGPLPAYALNLSTITSQEQFRHTLSATENTLPDLKGWLMAHLLLAGFSLVLVLIATLAFKRSTARLD